MPQPLYKVLYHKKGRFEFDPDGKIKNAIESLEKEVLKLVEFRKTYNGDKETIYIDKRIFDALSKICYLFKSADYSFEHEVRVVHYMPLGNDAIKVSPNNTIGEPPCRLYILSNNEVLPYLDKIYLGPKVSNVNQWSVYFDYEIRKRLKDEKIKNNVEVIKSACSFQ